MEQRLFMILQLIVAFHTFIFLVCDLNIRTINQLVDENKDTYTVYTKQKQTNQHLTTAREDGV